MAPLVFFELSSSGLRLDISLRHFAPTRSGEIIQQFQLRTRRRQSILFALPVYLEQIRSESFYDRESRQLIVDECPAPTALR